MGKTVGLIGAVRGKVGNVVYYVRNGVQTMRVYNPKPANPKTEGQNAARLKMVLAGRLSKIVPDAAIEGFGGSRQDRRSAFNSNVLTGAVVSGGRASIAYGDVVFSRGSLGVLNGHTVTAGASTAIQRQVVVNVVNHANEGELPEGYGERYVVLCMNAATSQFDYCETGLLAMPAAGATATTNVYVRTGDNGSEYVGLVYVVPFVASAGRGGVRDRYSYVGTEDGTLVVDVLTGETLGAPEVFGMSQFIRAVTLPEPT